MQAYKEAAMIEPTADQARELAQPEPVAIDPRTREAYVLVRRETYERMKALLALDDYDPDEGAAHINEVMAEDDAGDPLLESYQRYGKNGPGLPCLLRQNHE
jgi:PHD/YefM family antitoxin component YafN of YafNO toxin-antitoxin module